MLSSIQIHNKIVENRAKLDAAEKSFNAAEGDAKDIYRDTINQIKGENKSLDEQLAEALDYEDKIRQGGGIPLADPNAGDKSEFKPKNLGEFVLGARDEFKGLKMGTSIALDAYQDFKLAEHKDTDYTLPEQYIQSLPKLGIYNTLPRAVTDNDSVTFYEADQTKLTNAAATWTPGKTIAMSGMAWTQRSFHMEQIANGMPLLENNLNDYNELMSLVNGTLLYMQELAKGAKVLTGPKANAETGIVGILNHDGIQKFTKGASDSITDSTYKMATDVFLATGFVPTTVGMHPYVAESVNLEKDKNGRYINQMVNGKLWALNVVEDLNLTETTGETSGKKTTYGMMVYLPNAATFYTKMGEKLELGLVDDQFLRNEKTIRINGQYGLKVTFPKAFSYLADTGVAGR